MANKVIAFDIDETIIHNTMQRTLDKWNPGQGYSATEFAQIPDRYADITRWDFDTEWESADLNVRSITQLPFIESNYQKIMDYWRKGYDVTYITSRGNRVEGIEEKINDAVSDKFGFRIEGYALGDYQKYGTEKLPVKKANALTELTQRYDEVVFMDDEDKNLEAARQIPGVIVIKADV